MKKFKISAVLDFLKWLLAFLFTFFYRRKEVVDKERLLSEVSTVESKMTQVQGQIDQAQAALESLPGLKEQKAELRGVLNTLYGLLRVLENGKESEIKQEDSKTSISKKEKKEKGDG